MTTARIEEQWVEIPISDTPSTARIVEQWGEVIIADTPSTARLIEQWAEVLINIDTGGPYKLAFAFN